MPGIALAQIEVPRPPPPGFDFQPRPWPEEFYQSSMTRGEALEYRIVNALFDGNTSIPLYDSDIPGIGSGAVRIGRNIFNNYDTLNTWTVIDSFSIRLASRIVGADLTVGPPERIPDQVLQFPVGGMRLGVDGSFEIRNIRQMSPEKARTKEALDFENAGPGDEADIEDLNPYLNSSPLDAAMRVKLRDVLNLVKLPFKIPFHANCVKKRMKKNEIISYTVSGTAGFGGDFGWNVSPVPLIEGYAGVGVEFHFTGSYQIAIMKEDDRYAKVRISRLKGDQLKVTAGTRLGFPGVFQGFVLFKGSSIETTVGRLSPTITPFQFTATNAREIGLDVGYRYDLESPEGRDAYHRAVLGSFIRSSELSAMIPEEGRPPVERLYRRKTDRHLHNAEFSGRASPVIRFSVARGSQKITTEIELPDGEKRFFQSVKSRSREYDFVGSGERVTHRTSILIDDQAFREKLEDSFVLMSENSIDDSYTMAASLNRYVGRVETDLGLKGIFPRFPRRAPPAPGKKLGRRLFYGRSSFYFGMTFKLSGLRRFLETPWEEIDRRAKGLGLRLKQRWFEEAREAFLRGDAQAEHAALTRLFANQGRSELYPILLMEGLPNGTYERFLVAQNPAFGNIQVRGHTPTAMENTLRISSQSMGMGTETERTAQDPEALVRSFYSSRDALGRTVIHFNLSKTPEFLYFRIQPMSRRHKKDAIEVIVYNRHLKFKEGLNSITLDPNSPDPLERKLSAKLLADETLFMTMGFSQRASEWGFGASQRFDTSVFYRTVPYW